VSAGARDTEYAAATEAVARTAGELVAAFGRHDKDAYFAHFSPNATFIFHSVGEPLRSRAAYEDLWSRWESQDGFRVRSCTSSNVSIQIHGDVGIFSHDVRTETEDHAGTAELAERETIVFHRTGAGWLAVHEHLSPHPAV
jgi:ketosteroid isomerase-like protein